jgi:hypothetical protein
MFDLLPWLRFFSGLPILPSWYWIVSLLILPQKGRLLLPIWQGCLVRSVVSMCFDFRMLHVVASKTVLAFNGHSLSAEDDLAPVPSIQLGVGDWRGGRSATN